MFKYRFHGVQVISEISLDLPIINEFNTSSPLQKTVHIAGASSQPTPINQALWTDPFSYPDGTPLAHLYLQNGNPLYVVARCGSFSIGETIIEVWPEPDAYPIPSLLGRVFGLWLERAGFPVLHGSCISTGHGKAIGLLGESGMGKSTLGTVLCDSGLDLVTDDLIPLVLNDDHIQVFPGIPMSRLWPDTGTQLIENFLQAEKVHPESIKRKIYTKKSGEPRFSKEPHILDTLFILRRKNGEKTPISKRLLGPAEALMALVGLSYRPEPIHVLGMQPQRLKTLALTVEKLKIMELSYPSGFHMLEEVCQAILAPEQDSDSLEPTRKLLANPNY